MYYYYTHTAGHDLNIEIFGEMVVPNAASKDMQLAVSFPHN